MHLNTGHPTVTIGLILITTLNVNLNLFSMSTLQDNKNIVPL